MRGLCKYITIGGLFGFFGMTLVGIIFYGLVPDLSWNQNIIGCLQAFCACVGMVVGGVFWVNDQ